MFGFLRRPLEQQLYSEIWPNATSLAVFNGNPTYSEMALKGSLAIASLSLAHFVFRLNKNQAGTEALSKVQEMIFAALEQDENYYFVKDILLLKGEQELWQQETNLAANGKSRVHAIFQVVFSVRCGDHLINCRKDLDAMQERPGHMGLEFFTKRVLSEILGKAILKPKEPMEDGLDDTLSVAYFNAQRERLSKF